MIELENVTKNYTIAKSNTVNAVRGVSLKVERGEFIVITGRSGSGKTTVLNLVAGMTKPTSGRVILDGDDLWSLSDNEQSARRNRKMGFIFQFPSLLPSLNVLQNVVLPTIFGSRQSAVASTARGTALLHQVGLDDKLSSFPRQLSAGQQQRVVIARALMLNPEIILADEPTSDLDENTEQEIMTLLQSIHRTSGATILLVTHTRTLTSYGTRSIEMAEGLIRPN
ncbi:MAG: ABC transporter ATP-binding protein [Anaerolineae bacterium]